MVTRLEKNKKIQRKINQEKSIKYGRTLLKIVLLLGFMFVVCYLNLRYLGTNFIKTKEYMIKDSHIPNSFNGVKILHFSDLLYGSTTNEKDLLYLEEEFQRIKPDLVIFTGDIIDKNYNLDKEELTKLKDFFKNIPYNIGKYAVMGDFDNNTFDLIMKDSEFIVLDNEYKLVYYQENNPIAIIGLNSNNIDLSKINDDINNYYKLTLIHNFDNYNKNIKSNIVFAGHNLNGEIYLPFYKGVFGNNKYNGKYYEMNNTKVFISNGLGSIHRMRLFNHPSINVYRLSTNN